MVLEKSQRLSSLWQSCDELRGGMDESLLRRRDKIRAVKQGMMQQLLSGRMPLVELEGAVTPL
jgi:hypothetical protein